MYGTLPSNEVELFQHFLSLYSLLYSMYSKSAKIIKNSRRHFMKGSGVLTCNYCRVLSPILNLDCRMYSLLNVLLQHLLASESKLFQGDAGDRTRMDAAELVLKFATNRKLIN